MGQKQFPKLLSVCIKLPVFRLTFLLKLSLLILVAISKKVIVTV